MRSLCVKEPEKFMGTILDNLLWNSYLLGVDENWDYN